MSPSSKDNMLTLFLTAIFKPTQRKMQQAIMNPKHHKKRFIGAQQQFEPIRWRQTAATLYRLKEALHAQLPVDYNR